MGRVPLKQWRSVSGTGWAGRCSIRRTVAATLLVVAYCCLAHPPSLGSRPAEAADLNVGDILVANENAGTIGHYSSSGADQGTFAAGLSAPAWITTDRGGNVYVAEFGAGRIQKYS